MIGCDVSNHQGTVNWAEVASAGIQFAICKATEGLAFVDAYYPRNVAGARANGILPGAYHYARTENDPEREADFFLRTALDDLAPGDLLALDIEEVHAGGVDVAAWSLAWLARVEAATGCKPLVYSFPYFIQTHLSDPALAAYPLWLASWQAANPTVPAPWTGYAVWQFTSQGTVAGIRGHADVNRTDLDRAGLVALGLPAASADAAMEATYQANAATLGGKRFAGVVDRPYWRGTVLVCDGGIVRGDGGVLATGAGAVDDLVTYWDAHNVLTRL